MPVLPAPRTADDQHLPPALARQAVPTCAGRRTESDNLLRLSCALAVGDVRRAVERLNQAKRLEVRYGPLDDSPAKVEATIAKYQEIVTLDRNTEAGCLRLRPPVDGRVRGVASLRAIRRGGSNWPIVRSGRESRMVPSSASRRNLLAEIGAAPPQSDT